jgi:hypothetical protein
LTTVFCFTASLIVGPFPCCNDKFCFSLSGASTDNLFLRLTCADQDLPISRSQNFYALLGQTWQ